MYVYSVVISVSLTCCSSSVMYSDSVLLSASANSSDS